MWNNHKILLQDDVLFVSHDKDGKDTLTLDKKQKEVEKVVETVETSSMVKKETKTKTKTKEIETELLPVLDHRFNLREICKQLCLLEDHLCQKSKRCIDCCIKHFLCVEALAEECISLYTDMKNDDEISTLPDRIRSIEKKWLENPSENALQCSQLLRAIRKQYMEKTFGSIFEKNAKGCGSKRCVSIL